MNDLRIKIMVPVFPTLQAPRTTIRIGFLVSMLLLLIVSSWLVNNLLWSYITLCKRDDSGLK